MNDDAEGAAVSAPGGQRAGPGAVLDDVVETIAKGIPIQQRGQDTGERIVLLHRGHEVVLSLYHGQGRETWLPTGYKTGVSDINFDLSQLKDPIFFKPN